ncbi:MAG TPA: MATE family efflux transporter [Kofleriaceae bacterium]|nr:MATE family efflux transporter [Kofleriaceae bacterium]
MSFEAATGDSVEHLNWTDRPARELLRLAAPITVSTLSFSAMTLASTAFVAHIGKDELAGVGLGGVVAFALVCFGIGLLRGAKTLVSQAIGAGRRDRIDHFLGAAVGIGFVLGCAALVLGHVVAPILEHISHSPRAGAFAAEYLAIRSLGAPFLLVLVALREGRYGEGDTARPMRSSLAGNVVNIALDATLILGLGWGVKGAAVAALCGNLVELFVLAWPMRRRVLALRWRRDAARAVWKQGLPNGLQFVMEVGAFLILTAMVATMSSADGAAHQMVLHLANVSFLPAHALAEAASVLVGQAVGAGRYDLVPKVARRALLTGGAYAVVCSVALAVLGSTIAGAFAAGDDELARAATALIHVSLAFLVADAANVIARGVLRGASDVRYAATVGIITSWLTTPPLAWFFGVRLGLGARGGWIGLAFEIIVGASLFWLRVWRGGWRTAARAARREMIASRPRDCGDVDDARDDSSELAVA